MPKSETIDGQQCLLLLYPPIPENARYYRTDDLELIVFKDKVISVELGDREYVEFEKRPTFWRIESKRDEPFYAVKIYFHLKGGHTVAYPVYGWRPIVTKREAKEDYERILKSLQKTRYADLDGFCWIEPPPYRIVGDKVYIKAYKDDEWLVYPMKLSAMTEEFDNYRDNNYKWHYITTVTLYYDDGKKTIYRVEGDDIWSWDKFAIAVYCAYCDIWLRQHGCPLSVREIRKAWKLEREAFWQRIRRKGGGEGVG